MGRGYWSADDYAATTKKKVDSGTTFGYDRYARTTRTYEPHANLDPFKVVNSAGVIESRDNPEHPNSIPIVMGLDQTGSMGSVPRVIQTKLKEVFSLLNLRGYVEDPQISIAAYGDTHADPIRTTVQISAFESDNRIDDNLDNLLLYGGGGGNQGETMTGLWYMMSKVESDAWEKRMKKGYAFFVADEVALDLTAEQVKGFCGDAQPSAPLTVKELAANIKETWEVFILLVNNRTAKNQRSEKFYTDLFGIDHVLVLEDPDVIAETIALTIGVNEGTIDLDEGADDLRKTGTNEVAIHSASDALRNAGLDRLVGRGQVVRGGTLDIGNTGPSTTVRL